MEVVIRELCGIRRGSQCVVNDQGEAGLLSPHHLVAGSIQDVALVFTAPWDLCNGDRIEVEFGKVVKLRRLS